MSYEVDLQIEQDHVRAEVFGERRFGDAAADAGQVGEQIVEVCQKNGISRALLVLNLSGRLSAVDTYEIVVNSKDYGWSHSFKLAIVDRNAESFEDSLFMETVAVNRFYSVKVFSEETEALDWLLKATK